MYNNISNVFSKKTMQGITQRIIIVVAPISSFDRIVQLEYRSFRRTIKLQTIGIICKNNTCRVITTVLKQLGNIIALQWNASYQGSHELVTQENI